jgi:acetylornithine/N-succinyldiaminopimelate aminotransferase
LASAAALAVLDVLENDGLLEQVKQRGEQLSALLAKTASKFPKLVECARGRGLLQALVLREGVDARKVMSSVQEAGVLLTIAGGQALRFSPPLIVTQAELEEGVTILERALASYV